MNNKNLYLVEVSTSSTTALPPPSPFDLLGGGGKTSVYYVMGVDYDEVERKALLHHSMNIPPVPVTDSMGSLNVNLGDDATYIVKSIKLISEKVVI